MYCASNTEQFSLVSYKDRKELAADLKPILYTAATEDEALLALESLESKWGQKYPQISKSWLKHWANLVGFLQYPKTIRKMIYTTNAIESVNSGLRKITNNKRIFPKMSQCLNLFIAHRAKLVGLPPRWKAYNVQKYVMGFPS